MQTNDGLHSLNREEIVPGISLTCITTDKFKTGCITINLLCKLSRDTASSLTLIPRILRRGSKDHPNMEAISAALDNLYGARIEPLNRKKGEMQCIGLFADFPDDRYLPDNKAILEDTIGLLGEMLINPSLIDGEFNLDYVTGEKSNLIDDIKAAINDKRGYAVDRLLEEMCPDEAYGVSKLGTEESVKAITPKSLTDLYNNIISNAKIEIFYCGAASPKRVKAALLSSLSKLPARPGAKIPETKIIYTPKNDAPRTITEEMDVTQGKLTMGFRVGQVMQNPNYPALIMFNSIYGGSVTSKLFTNVREKLSLCYYASSMLDKHKGIMLVASGVEFDKYEMAKDEIFHQLDLVKRGEISDFEFEAAKKYVVSSIKTAMDRLGGLEELYFDSIVSAAPYVPLDICDNINNVTCEQVSEIAKSINAELIYFLTGK